MRNKVTSITYAERSIRTMHINYKPTQARLDAQRDKALERYLAEKK
jgi:hypothetical protein